MFFKSSKLPKLPLAAAVGAAMLTLGAMPTSTMFPKPEMFSHWKAPRHASKHKNPIPINSASIHAGEAIFTQNCVACHGANAKGDGPTGAFLSPHPANLTTAKFWKQTDGAIFWKITHGKSPMPSFQDSLSRKQRWQVIDYLRHTFGPGKGK